MTADQFEKEVKKVSANYFETRTNMTPLNSMKHAEHLAKLAKVIYQKSTEPKK